MYASIVVGTDGSPTARVAVQQAMELAKRCDATVHVVTAIRPVGATASVAAAGTEMESFTSPEVLEEISTSLRSEADAILQEACETADKAGVKAERHTASGDASEAILEVADAQGADLIVVGNRGMSGAKRFLLGSVPNKISHHAPCSVLIVNTAG